MSVRVVLSNGFSMRHTDGEKEFVVVAKNLRGVLREMEARYPGIGAYLEEETTVAIDGEMHEIAYFLPLQEGSEVFFLPKMEAG